MAALKSWRPDGRVLDAEMEDVWRTIELTLADGRRISSDIAVATFTQPPTWPYVEGVLVPHGQDVTVDPWFDPKR